MRRIILIVALTLFACLSFAQDSNEPEQILVKKGNLIIKEFIDFGSFGNYFKGKIVVLTDVETENKTFSISIKNSYYSGRVILDASEIESIINSISYMIEKSNNISSTAPYTEISYQSENNFSFGFYIEKKKGKMFVKTPNDTNESVYSSIDKLGLFKLFFEDAKNKIIELGGTIK